MDDGERERSDVAGPSVHGEPPARFPLPRSESERCCCRHLNSRGRRHSRHVGGSDALGHACAQTGEPIKIGYSMSVTGGLAPDGRTLAVSRTPLPQLARFPRLVSDLQIGAVSYRLNRLFDRQGAQEKTVRVHPPSRRILELRASSCIFRKKDGASAPSIVFRRPLHYVSPDRFVFEVDEREPLPKPSVTT